MSTKNSVFQVLVTKGNQDVLAEGQPIEALKSGQIGVFDLETNLAIGTDGSGVREFFIAVGVDNKGTGKIDEIRTSAGQYIQKKNVRDYTFRPHTASQPQILEITDFIANCETDYTLKFEFRNIEILRMQGTTGYTRAYSVRTSCCGCNTDCPSGSPVELAYLLYKSMKNDTAGLFKVELIESAGGTVIEDDQVETWVKNPANKDKKPGLRITVNGSKVQDFCNIPHKPYNPRQTTIMASLVDGFNCTGKVTVTQEATTEEGNGADIKLKEFHAGGWNGQPGPYRVSTVNGLAKNNFKYFADSDIKYDQVHLVYDHESEAGWGDYTSNIFTNIAIPATDTTTRDSFVRVLDGLVTSFGFDTLVDDAQASNTDETIVEPTTKRTKKTDGIA